MGTLEREGALSAQSQTAHRQEIFEIALLFVLEDFVSARAHEITKTLQKRGVRFPRSKMHPQAVVQQALQRLRKQGRLVWVKEESAWRLVR